MTRSEWKAVIESAKQRVAQAEFIAASINRLNDLQSYHSYAGFKNVLNERDLQTALRYDTPSYADAALPMPAYYVNFAQALENSSNETLAAAQRWSANTETYPPTEDYIAPSPSPTLTPTPTPSGGIPTWGLYVLGGMAIAGGLTLFFASNPSR